MNSSTSQSEASLHPPAAPVSPGLNRGLWAAQGMLSLTFFGGALWKFLTPLAEIAKAMSWVSDVLPAFFYMTAACDLAGGIFVFLPSFTSRYRYLTWLAALGCAALQLCAFAFHLSRGEAIKTPLNVFLFGLSVFVFWGRRKSTSST